MESAHTRQTLQRSIVLETVRLLNHPTAEEVYEAVHSEYPGISKGTVYRNLNLLSGRHSILHIPNPYGADHYDHTVKDHYHLTCRVCGKVFDVDFPYFSEIESMIKDKRGFAVEHHDIVFTGICPECKKNNQNRADDPAKS